MSMHNPHQLFVVATVSRAMIAENLNDVIVSSEMYSNIEPFEDDDERLTDEVCQTIADQLYDLAAATSDMNEEDEREIYAQSLEVFSGF
jgi:hypothetical protein